MSDENFDSGFDEIDNIEDIENEEVTGIFTSKTSNVRPKNRRKWRQIEEIKDQKKLLSDLQTIENYDF
jgi:hypothetical protein